MTRALFTPFLLSVALVACGADDGPTGDTGPTCVVNDTVNAVPAAGAPSGPVSELGLHIFPSAQIRYDPSTNLPGSLDLEDGEDISLLQGVRLDIVPAQDPPDGNQPGCIMILPVTEGNSVATSGVLSNDVWGADVTILASDIVTNCGDPAYASITNYAGGVQNLVNAQAEVMSIGIGEPSQDAIDVITAREGASSEQFALGGTVQLGPDSPQSELLVTHIATDACGVIPDGADRELADTALQGGLSNGVYLFETAIDIVVQTFTAG